MTTLGVVFCDVPLHHSGMKWAGGCCVLIFTCCAAASLAACAYPPAVTVRWIDWQQEGQFAVESPKYSCRVDTGPARIAQLSVGNVDWFGAAGASWQLVDEKGVVYAPASMELTPSWKTWQKQSYQPAKSSRARMNVWSAGPYYWDAHLLDIPMISAPAESPLRGEVVFHAHRDQLRIQFRMDIPQKYKIVRMELLCAAINGEIVKVGSRTAIVKKAEGAAAAMLLPPDARVDLAAGVISWTAGENSEGSAIVFREVPAGLKLEALFANDLSPLDANAFALKNAAFAGYDTASGLYVLSTTQRKEAFSFEESFRNPARRIESNIVVRNAEHSRSILLKTQTGVGNLEAAVVADQAGFPLPIPAQLSKNFAGEMEEPDDTAFGDSYVPLELKPNETKSFQLFHLTQNWGQSPLKQVSSVRFFHIYWHLSTGASETTCFSMNWMEAGFKGAFEPTVFHIPDYRPMSGPTWPGQPQHHCAQFPGFLQYNSGKVRLVYDYTTFDSISPLLCRFTMHFHTSDNAARASLAIMESPQTDEMRTFIHLRYDWDEVAKIEGDARDKFRTVNIFEHDTPQRLLWVGSDGKTAAIDVRTDTQMTVEGVALSEKSPFLATHRTSRPTGDDQFQSLVLVRNFHARLEGREINHGAISARFNEKTGSYWLTTEAKSLSLRPGDFVEADIVLMPHGEPAPEWLKPERERMRFATDDRPLVEAVSLGKELGDFPAMILADANAVSFQLRGGVDRLPITVEGFSPGAVPLLWCNGLWQDQQLLGGDYYQVEPDDKGLNRIIISRRIRDGQAHDLTVTAIQTSTSVCALRSNQGRLVIQLKSKGEATLEAPIVFGPGENRFDQNRQLFKIESNASLLQEVPARIVSSHVCVKSLNDAGAEMSVDGPAKVTAQRGWIIIDGEKRARELQFASGTREICLEPYGGHDGD